MSAVLTSLQDEIAERLRSDTFFASVPILAERPRDLGYEIERTLGELGLVVIVSPPEPANFSATGRPAKFEDLRLLVRVVEDPVLNDIETGPDGAQAAEQILALLHRHQPASAVHSLHAADNPVRLLVEGSLVVREVNFSTAAPSTS